MASSSSFSPVLYRTLGMTIINTAEDPEALGGQQLIGDQQLTGCVGSSATPGARTPGPQLVVFQVLPESQGP